MSTNKANIAIAIIGGGLGGVTAAIALGRAGYSVHLFEQAPEFAEIGKGIAIGPNAMPVFERLGILEKYTSVAEMYEDGSTWTKFLSWRDGSKVADVKIRGLGSSVHRKQLLEVLVSLLPSNVQTHFSARIIGVSNIPASAQREEHVRLDIAAAKTVQDRQVQAQEQTWTFEADAVIGADGVKSVVRELIDINAGVRWTGSCVYRSLLSMERVKQVNSEFSTAIVWIGPGKCLTTYPIEHGTSLNVSVIEFDESRPAWEGPWVKPIDRETLLGKFAGWDERAVNIIKLMDTPEEWALHDLVPLSRWTIGRVTLLGDSAHASTPFNGAGAAQAIEDAYVLGALLALPECNKETLPGFLQAYEDVRRPRAAAQQLHAFASGEIYQLRGPYGDDLDRIGVELHTRFHWIWEHDLDQDVEAAKAKLCGEVLSQ